MKIKAGIIGMGYIGASHIEAVRRLGFAEITAVADIDYELARYKADEYNIPKCCRTADDMFSDEEIDVIHNCTPNNMHLEYNIKAIRAGKHIFSEKPLARTSDESSKMLDLLDKNQKIVNGINYVYRMNPLVQDIKNRVRKGEVGRPMLIHGSYLQDWLLYDTDYNWRIEPEISGPSRCMADIGSHWIDCVQTVTSAKIIAVCADLVTVLPIRKKPKRQVETFSENTENDYEEVKINTEDYGAVIFKMDNGAHGVFYSSEVSAGRKCHLNFEINGTKASMYWNQETADRMWVGFRDKSNHEVIRDPLSMTSAAGCYTHLAAGHPEGWNDAMKNSVFSFYKFIAEGKVPGRDECDFATFKEGHYIMKLTEAILESNKQKCWIKVKEDLWI